MTRPDAQIDLGAAALAIGRAAEPDVDPAPSLAALDEFAAGVRDVRGLRRRLFAELGFRGNVEDYYDPANSLLHRVIERRLGIPISLSVVLIEVGRRAGIALSGIGMPAHFVVRDDVSGLYIDAFNGGDLLDGEALAERFRTVTGAAEGAPFRAEHRPVLSKREILARMLGNLLAVYAAREDAASVEWVLRFRLALPEVPREEGVQLADAIAAQGRVLEAARELDARAAAFPELREEFSAASRRLRARLN